METLGHADIPAAAATPVIPAVTDALAPAVAPACEIAEDSEEEVDLEDRAAVAKLCDQLVSEKQWALALPDVAYSVSNRGNSKHFLKRIDFTKKGTKPSLTWGEAARRVLPEAARLVSPIVFPASRICVCRKPVAICVVVCFLFVLLVKKHVCIYRICVGDVSGWASTSGGLLIRLGGKTGTHTIFQVSQ